MDETTTLFFRFGVSAVLGILVGLQREFAFDRAGQELVAGIRTFTIIAILGCCSALICEQLQSPLPFVAIVLILGAFFAVSHYLESFQGSAGLTTEISALITFITGALSYWGHVTLAIALGVALTVLLSMKFEMHRFVARITREDIYATLKFAVITAIILPVLPNRGFATVPFDVLNPFKIWLLVVFISGISFIGFILIKLIGAAKGIGVTGLLGGLASSTAVTLSFTERSRSSPALAQAFALAITLAWTVMFSRVLAAVAVLNMALVKFIWIPITVGVLVGLLNCLYLLRVTKRGGEKAEVTFANPFELGPAIKFGLVFSIVLLLSKAAQTYLGEAGVYLSSFVSGLADADAIAISIAELAEQPDGMSLTVGARAIVLAAVANTIAKGGIVFIGGAPALRKAMIPGFISIILTTLAAGFLI
jgi:uncharacterized membrane protein (DUF4010 family)